MTVRTGSCLRSWERGNNLIRPEGFIMAMNLITNLTVMELGPKSGKLAYTQSLYAGTPLYRFFDYTEFDCKRLRKYLQDALMMSCVIDRSGGDIQLRIMIHQKKISATLDVTFSDDGSPLGAKIAERARFNMIGIQ